MIAIFYLLIGVVVLLEVYYMAIEKNQTLIEFALGEVMNTEAYKDDERMVSIIIVIEYIVLWPFILFAKLYDFVKGLRH